AVKVSISPTTPLATGTHVGEVIFTSVSGSIGMVVPITLTVNGTTATATPTFNPPGGTYTAAQSLSILDATRDSAIYYTLDGSTPTTSSAVYSTPILVTATKTIKGISIAPGYPQSLVGTAI